MVSDALAVTNCTSFPLTLQEILSKIKIILIVRITYYVMTVLYNTILFLVIVYKGYNDRPQVHSNVGILQIRFENKQTECVYRVSAWWYLCSFR